MSSVRPWVVLVDCNNFFASCERLFRPDLNGKPVVVLSNNDGCVISRSEEVKRLGSVPMGMPLFKARDLLKRHGIHVFSGNHELYADISNRVMRTLGTLAGDVEVYSVDEAFLHVAGEGGDMLRFGRDVRERVAKWVGIPVSVGIAPTKTLAKIATEYCKNHPETGGALCLESPESWRPVIGNIPIEDVWGIGRRMAPKLRMLGVRSALDLASAPAAVIRSRFGVNGERVLRELQGLPCYDDQGLVESRRQIMCSRSFGIRVTDYRQLHEATCKFVEQAAMRLRKARELCSSVSVFARSMVGHDRFDRPVYQSIHATGSLDYPTDDTRHLIGLAASLLKDVWVEGLAYCKSGVLLSNFSSPGMVQMNFSGERRTPNADKLMETLDRLKESGHHIHFAGQGLVRQWTSKRESLSPRYTTKWRDIPLIDCNRGRRAGVCREKKK